MLGRAEAVRQHLGRTPEMRPGNTTHIKSASCELLLEGSIQQYGKPWPYRVPTLQCIFKGIFMRAVHMLISKQQR